MIRIAICDDDYEVINILQRSLSDYQLTTTHKFNVQSFSSGEKLLGSSISFDLIFLDIEMTGIDGIATAKVLRQRDRKVKIVYITSHPEYALNVYTVHPFDYAVKPVSSKKIATILNEFIAYIETSAEDSAIIELKSVNGPLLLELKNIVLFEYTKNRRIMVYTQNDTYLITGGISEILTLLKSDIFTSPHKSFIINMEFVKSLNNYTICMTNNIEVPVAQKKLKEFQNEFRRFIKNYIRQE